jgi:hypothetical protein
VPAVGKGSYFPPFHYCPAVRVQIFKDDFYVQVSSLILHVPLIFKSPSREAFSSNQTLSPSTKSLSLAAYCISVFFSGALKYSANMSQAQRHCSHKPSPFVTYVCQGVLLPVYRYAVSVRLSVCSSVSCVHVLCSYVFSCCKS